MNGVYNAGVDESSDRVMCPTPAPAGECKSKHDFTTARPPTDDDDDYYDYDYGIVMLCHSCINIYYALVVLGLSRSPQLTCVILTLMVA